MGQLAEHRKATESTGPPPKSDDSALSFGRFSQLGSAAARWPEKWP
jgi:hypothetical protein